VPAVFLIFWTFDRKSSQYFKMTNVGKKIIFKFSVGIITPLTFKILTLWPKYFGWSVFRSKVHCPMGFWINLECASHYLRTFAFAKNKDHLSIILFLTTHYYPLLQQLSRMYLIFNGSCLMWSLWYGIDKNW
jgi:hypothetical protein